MVTSICRVFVSVGFRCHSETSLELTVEVLLAPVPEVERHCLNLHARTNLRRSEHHARTRNVIMYRYPDLVAKQSTEVRRLSAERSRQRGEGESLSVVLVNLLQHPLDMLLSGRRAWHWSPPLAQYSMSVASVRLPNAHRRTDLTEA
jgi:hypothetical protein